MDTLPTWRRNARPGISLAEAMTRADAAPAAGAAGRPAAAAARLLKRAPEQLMRILRPEASVRWRSTTLEYYTPEVVELILRNALGGDLQSQWELFDLMEDTWPRLAKNLNEIKRAVSAMQWTVRPWAEDKEKAPPESVERSKLVSHVLWKMDPDVANDERDFGGIVYDLLDAWGKGVSVIELLWETRSAAAYGDFIAIRCGQWVHPVNYALDADGRLGLRAEPSTILSRAAVVDPFPPYKFLVGSARARTAHFTGAALLRPLAWWWAASNFSADWLLNFAQLFGLPIRWATHASGASQSTIDEISDMMTNLGSAGWAVFPEGTTLELHEAAKSGTDNPQSAVLDRADTICDTLILGQTLTTDAGERGTQALGTVHERVRGDVLQTAADWAAGILTGQLVRYILELNYGDTEWSPEIAAAPRREKDAQANAQRDAILLSAGMALPKSWLYERHDIPLPEPGEETVGGGLPAGMGLPPRMPQDDPDEAGGSDPTAGSRKRPITKRHATAAGRGVRSHAAMASERVDSIVGEALARGLGARMAWLQPLDQEIRRLAEVASDPNRSDAELLRLIQAGRDRLPELFFEMDTGALAEHLAGVLGAAAKAGATDRL